MALRVQTAVPTYLPDETYPDPVALTQNSSLTLICSIRCKTGVRPILTVYAQDMITSGGVDYVTWHLYRNGNPLYPYHSHKNQVSSPYDNQELPGAIPLEQGDLIAIYADLGAAGAGNFYAAGRLRVEYEALEENR